MEHSRFLRPLGALISPGKTFASIAERPTWLVPLLLIVLFASATALASNGKVDYGDFLAQQTAGQDLPEEDLEKAVEMMNKFGWAFALVGSLVTLPIGILVGTLIFWLVFKVLGSEMTFPVGLGVTTHAMMPMVIATVITVFMILARDALTMTELQNGLLASNPAAFLSADASPTLAAVLRQFDFFSFWVLALMIIGFRAATKLRPSTVTWSVAALWAFWMFAKFGMQWINIARSGG